MLTKIRLNIPEDCNLFLAGDMQWGNACTHESGIDRLFHALEAEFCGCSHNRLILMGDLVETIDISDRRFAFDSSRLHLLRDQRDHAVQRLSAVRHKLLLLLRGNHEYRIHSTYGNISAEIADALGCLYGGYACVPSFIGPHDRLLFRFFLHHGFGRLTSHAKDWLQAQANIKASLKNKLQHLFAGAVLMAMGHTHQLLIVPPDPSLQIISDEHDEAHAIYRDDSRYHFTDQAAWMIPEQFRWYVNTGSFLKLYEEGVESYGERLGLRPVELGYAVALVRGGRIADVVRVTV